MKKGLWILGAVILVAALAGGGFYAGMQYQQSLADQAQANFIQMRGEGGGAFPGGGQMLPGGELPAEGQVFSVRGGMGGGLMGTVKSLDGETLTLSTAEDVTTVTLSDATTVRMTVTGDLSDLAEGARVMVTGETDKDGSLTATQIQILSSDFTAPEPTP